MPASTCSRCSAELPAVSRFCLACGKPVSAADADSSETVAMGLPTPRPVTGGGGQRFAPGTLLASRYRIISRLGKGGMGEVFRADDIVLGQEVALKFLPPAAKSNVNLLTRFYDEVRIARQISHPHVCRVYDIGEVEGQPYLSMEYIDGEDLAGLLRRIGRLPGDKALEFARKICAGVGAAHAKGVLHRDLKPGNIMIDSRGEPHITDFGLAAMVGIEGDEVRNGTPAYMAPEQLEGREVSVQSDIYALGLVFYEMFTGKLPHQAATTAEMLRMRQESRVTNPSALVTDIEPVVERAILRCLDPDPKQRPASAMALAASLPGGDPLAAALAAGETPSPEIVAASGSEAALGPKTALAAAGGVAAGLIALFWLVPQAQLLNRLPMENPPQVIVAKTRDIVRSLGYTAAPADTALGIFDRRAEYFGYLGKQKLTGSQWNDVVASPPAPVSYWFRQSPSALVAQRDSAGGVISLEDPPPEVPGMLSLQVDLDGRLLQFSAVPPRRQTQASAAEPPPDWTKLFAAARLDPAQFTPATPEWAPLAATDERVAWTGVYPGPAKLPVRIEAAAFAGQFVYFEVVWPWTTAPGRAAAASETAAQRWFRRVVILALIGVVIGACYLAWFNWKAGRGDARGAVRVGLWVALFGFLAWLLGAHHVADADGEMGSFATALTLAVFDLALFWVGYLALEPWVRRHWPASLVTWSRILQGRWRDPAVGRDVLFGVLISPAYLLLFTGAKFLDMRLNPSGPQVFSFNFHFLLGLPAIGSGLAAQLRSGISSALLFFLMLFLLRAVLRRMWLAGAAFVAIWTLQHLSQNDFSVAVTIGVYGLVYSTLVFVMWRFGFFALVVTLFAIDWTASTLVTGNLGAWYAQSTWVTLLLLSGMALWGYRRSLGGRPILPAPNLEK